MSGEVTVGATHGVRVEVDVTSMTTGNRAWDEVIGAVDPFDTGRFPLAVYESTRVLWTAHRCRHRGPAHPARRDPPGRAVRVLRGRRATQADRMMVRAGGTVDRQAFGLRFDVPGVGKLVPRQLRLEIDVDVVRA